MHPYGAMDGSARMRIGKPKKELDHIEVKEGENGGHIATHHFTSYEYRPEENPFGENEGAKLLQHLREHLNIKVGKQETEK